MIPEDFYAMRRRGNPFRHALNARGDFIDSLRRVRSSQQARLKESFERIARGLGLHPSSTVEALHDSASGSTPGVAQAVYGYHRPEDVHTAAAWYALTSNAPGVAAFHVREGGPDSLYRFRHAGSGIDLRAKLDRAGIRDRVLIPHRHGFDVLVPDPGGKLYPAVAEHARRSGVELQVSRGYLKAIGSRDRGEARGKYRAVIERAERMARRGEKRRYSAYGAPEEGRLSAEQHELARQGTGGDVTAWGALGDHLAENGYPGAGRTLSRSLDGGRWHEMIPANRRERVNFDNTVRPGTFHYTVVRDGPELVHALRVNSGGRHFIFHYRETPSRT